MHKYDSPKITSIRVLYFYQYQKTKHNIENENYDNT